MTEAEPSVSTDERRCTIASLPGHALHAEGEHRGHTAGRPSGTAATASATPRIST